jgi:hypothetical protein
MTFDIYFYKNGVYQPALERKFYVGGQLLLEPGAKQAGTWTVYVQASHPDGGFTATDPNVSRVPAYCTYTIA